MYTGRRMAGRIAARLALLSTGRRGVVLLSTLSLAGAVCYVALVGTTLLTLPPEPTDNETVGLIQNTPDAPVAVLNVTVDEDTDEPADSNTDTEADTEADAGSDTESDTDATEGPEPRGEHAHRIICRGDAEADPEACALIDELDDPFAEAIDNVNCTDVDYGPERATITGYWNGTDVDTVVTRDGSCAEARWQRLRPLTQPVE